MTINYVVNQMVSIIYMIFDAKIFREINDFSSVGSVLNPFVKDYMNAKYRTIKIPIVEKLLYSDINRINKNLNDMTSDLTIIKDGKIQQDTYLKYSTLVLSYYSGVLSVICSRFLSKSNNDEDLFKLSNVQDMLIKYEKSMIRNYVQIALKLDTSYNECTNNNDVGLYIRQSLCKSIGLDVISPIASSAFNKIKSPSEKFSDIKRYYYEQDIYAMWLDLIMRSLISVNENDISDSIISEKTDEEYSFVSRNMTFPDSHDGDFNE